MQNETDLPSTETAVTPQPPTGENVKALVTPGDDAEREAEAERPHKGVGETDAANAAHPEDPEEGQSPT